MYTHATAAEIAERTAAIGTHVKQSALLTGSWEGAYAVATIVIDNSMPPAEVHEGAADVWIATKGTSLFTLGGALTESSTIKEGEYAGEGIVGGEAREVRPGDVVDIPAGVPHQIDARGDRAEFLIIKIRNTS